MKMFKQKIDRDELFKVMSRYTDLENNLSRLVTTFWTHENFDVIHSIIVTIKNELKRIREINLEIRDEVYRELTHSHLKECIDDELINIRLFLSDPESELN